jgi:hypothetical protein
LSPQTESDSKYTIGGGAGADGWITMPTLMRGGCRIFRRKPPPNTHTIAITDNQTSARYK